MDLTQLETPALLLDLEKLDRNIQSMHTHLKKLGVKFRPHGKTAKNIDVMSRVLKDEFGGITVSTVSEAEYYFGHGIRDLLYAVGIAPNKLERLIRLIRAGAQVTLLLDSLEQVAMVSEYGKQNDEEFPVLIEIDSDGHRAGVHPESEGLIQIGEAISGNKGILLEGVLTHAGASYACRSADCLKIMAAQERDAVLRCAQRLKEAGLHCQTVSVGSSPTATFAENLSGVTEVRAGVYMTGDLVMAGLGVCRIEAIAMSVLATVIGHQKEKNRLITDSGWMAMSQDRGTASQDLDQGYGLLCDLAGQPHQDLILTGTNQEHGLVSRRGGGSIDWERFPIGSLCRILPNHACATAAMFDGYYVLNSNQTGMEY